MSLRSRVIAAALASTAVIALSAVAGTAYAQSTETSKVAAEALFEDGRKLVADGKFAEACPKFADSQRLDPSPGTLLNLANCWEKSGKTATAWGTYRQAASSANATGRKDLLATAQRRADALSPKLARMTVSVAQPPDGLQLRYDGAPLDRAEWGVAIPVDAGPHTIEATAPAHKKWSTPVDVTQDGAQVTVTVPVLEELPPDATAAAPATGPAPATTTSIQSPPPAADVHPHGGGGTQRTVGIVVGAVGIVGLGLGTVFAVSAKGKYDDSLPNCLPNDKNLCNPQGLSQRDDARSAGTVGTVFFGVGAAALVTGVVLWFTAPSGSAHAAGGAPTGLASVRIAPTAGAGGAGAIATGAW